ncbi:MAG TPA: hypothetical protein ENH94_08590 [Phycisphaerales bacterium]|nr:hypothetical protein [Phycisphaerales bacterium]
MKTTDKIKITLTAIFIICAHHSLCTASVSDRIYKHYEVDIEVHSLIPENTFETYKHHSSGYSGDGGSVTIGCWTETRAFRINTKSRNIKNRLIVEVKITPDNNDKITKENFYKVDLTDLKPQSIELAKDDDGRVYQLNLTPNINVVDNTPKRADETSFGFTQWAFNNSMVIFNDSSYVGKMNMSGGPQTFVSYPGLAKVVFSLKPFKNAKRLGTLKNGTIQIRNEDGQTLDIYFIKNGYSPGITLPRGPYEVWVRWENLPGEPEFKIPPKEEWIKMVKERFAEMGNTPPTDKELDEGYKRIKYEKHLPLSAGVGSRL